MDDNAGGGRRGLRATPSQKLIEAVAPGYGLDLDRIPVDLGGSSNLNLLIGGSNERYVLRVYRSYVTTDRLGDIHNVRRALMQDGVPCGGLLPTREGQPWLRFEGRLVEVEHYVERDADMNTWERLVVGLRTLGRIHTILREMPVGEAGKTPLFANAIEPAKVLEQTLLGTRRIRGWNPTALELHLASAAEELARLVSQADISSIRRLPRQVVHGDFWDNNVFFRAGKLVYVTDFNYMGKRLRIDDLALTLFFTCMEYREDPASDDQLSRLRGLIGAYDEGSDRPLSAAERVALPFAIARQALWSIGGWVVWLDDETAARRHAAASATEVEWSLRLMEETARWQAAFT